MALPLQHPVIRGNGRGRGAIAPDVGWRERLQALKHLPKLLRMVWAAEPKYVLGILVLRVARSAVPLAVLWIGKLIVDAVVHGIALHGSGEPIPWSRLALLIGIELSIALVGEVLSRISALLESLLGDLFANQTSVELMRHAATLDLEQFENAEIYDKLERARRQTVGRIGLFTMLLATLQDLITLVSLSVALAVYVPWLLVLLAVAVLPSLLGETHFASLGYSLLYSWTPERRQLDYLRYIGASDISAKELKLFGLSDFLVGRYDRLSQEFYEANKALSVRRSIVSTLLAFVGTLGYYAAYAVIIYLTVIGYRSAAGLFTIGVLTFLAGSFRQSRDLIQRVLLSLSQVFEQALYLDDLFSFLEIEPHIRRNPEGRQVPVPIRSGFVFEHVGFRYPGAERWAVRGLNFALAPGERLALVGENGAGKTTLVKLLARLYDPSEGRILLDGVDLRDYDLDDVRRTIGVIFQDFVRYDMRFDENVGVGEVESVRDYLDAEPPAPNGGPPDVIARAAEKSLAASLLPRLPNSYRQMLGRRFDDGVDLSGGEWQKVALARAYMRDAQLLILDEPTAALDARAEYDVFLRFNALMAGRMAVVISHRFSTVRMADRIIVLAGGEVVQQGTHDELIAAAGHYAELFGMQAAGYR